MPLFASFIVTAAGVSSSSGGVLLDFTASWCGPCQQMKPIVQRLERRGYPIRQVNVDQNRALTRRFRITGIPAFVLVVNGKEVSRIVGPTSEQQLIRLMSQIPKRTSLTKAKTRTKSSTAQSRSETKSVPVKLVSGLKKRFQLPFTKQPGNAELKPPVPDLRTAVVRAKLDTEAAPKKTPLQYDPLAASVRIRVKDSTGASVGSGTVIDSRPGRTVILTCGHIFRGMKRNSTIEVDLFHQKQPRTFVGTILRYDMEADVGLLVIPTSTVVPAARLAFDNSQVKVGAPVFSIGCGGGSIPTRMNIRVTSLNRYHGPDTVECTVAQEVGRSGGGLFTARGDLVGVCFARDPRDQRGLYAGLKPIQTLLTQAKLAHLIAKPAENAFALTGTTPGTNSTTSPRHGKPPAETIAIDYKQLAMMREGLPATSKSQSPTRISSSNLSESATNRIKTVQDVFKNSSEAEVICIIRSLDNPRAASRVVIINRASAKFMDYLTGEVRNQPRLTSMRTERRKPVSRNSNEFSKTQPRFSTTGQRRPLQSPPLEPGRYRRSRASR